MASGGMDASVQPKNKYDNEIGCHIQAVIGMSGTASTLLDRLRAVANSVLGHQAETADDAAKGLAPRAEPNGSLAELKFTIGDLNDLLNRIESQVARLEKLH